MNKKSEQLLHAAAAGDLKTCKDLLERGAKVNAKNRRGFTPLHVAAANGHFHVVSYLLRRNANPLLRNEEGLMPVHLAAASGSIRTTRIMLLCGARLTAKNQRMATRDEYSIGKNVFLSVTDNYGCTPLHWAAWFNHGLVAEILIKAGADPLARDKYEKTPMDTALALGHTALYGYMQDVAAAEGIICMEAIKPREKLPQLHKAAAAGRTKAVQQLLESGDKVNGKDSCGRTALHHAVWMEHPTTVQALLKAGANPRATDMYGHTPVIDASFAHLDEILRMFWEQSQRSKEI